MEIKIVLLASPRRGCYASAVLTAPDRTAVLALTIFLAPRRNASSGEKDEACANAGIAKVAASLN